MHSYSAPVGQDVATLRLALSTRLQEHPGDIILGAQLGAYIAEALSPISYKSWLSEGHQNLQSFVEMFLSGIVTATTERSGYDFAYRIENRSQQIMQSFDGALWRAFCSIKPKQAIWYSAEESKLFLLPFDADQIPNTFKIEPISSIEHQTMREKFASGLDGDAPSTGLLRELAGTNRAYGVWVSALKLQSGLFAEWGRFRIANIKELFAARLKGATKDGGTQARLLSELEEDHRRLALPISATKVSKVPVAMAVGDAGVIDQSVRHTLMKAFETLSDSQMAKILVPLDVVAALLAQRK